MARRGRFAVRAALAALSVGLLAPTAAAAARPAAPQSPPPKAFVVVDVATGAVLASDHEHDALRPASTSKVMTALTAVERLAPDALVNVSPLAASQPASRINMQAGQQWPLNNALASLLLASANDAAYAIAETAGGSLDGFIAAEQETATRLGMEDSTFADPAGLDDETSYNGGPRMSAFDIAIATRNALAVPELAQWGATRKYEFVDPTGLQRSLTNHNRMLPGGTLAYEFATGFKTGFTERAGHTFVATASRDGRSLIAVILNTYDTYGWAVQLLDQGFATPNESGTGVTLPTVAVSPYAHRAADQQAFLTAARGHAAAQSTSEATRGAPVGSGPSSSASTAAPTTTVASPSSVVDGNAIAAQQPADDDDGDGGPVSLPLLIGILVVLLIAAFFLRRRAVRRHRARRIAQQRHRAAKMRSGGLPVVDGRFGPSAAATTESHVRIRRIDEDP